ncbi:MAG: hypothetical protein K2X01_00005, partial [Cyanobacteria bacterium]|nr:hypothetical protein [Cyanobacteriota bacterium]
MLNSPSFYPQQVTQPRNLLLQQYQQMVMADVQDDGVINGSIFNNMQGGGIPGLGLPQQSPFGGGFPGLGMPQQSPFGGGFPG